MKRWKIDQLASWNDGKMVKCQDQKLTNDNVVNLKDGKIESCQNGKLTNSKVYQMVSLQNGKLSTWQVDKFSSW